jgi:pre-mRNA-processing factor 40
LFFQIARELAEKASNQHSDRETGTTPALVGSASAEPSALPVNQSSSAIGSIDSSSLDASAKSVPAGVGPSLVDNTSASNNINMQNGGPSIAVVPVTPMTEVPSATDAGAIRFLQLL